MLLAAGPARVVGAASEFRLRFGEGPKIPESEWTGRRLLWLDDKPAFELSFWCGTCPFLFRRLEGAASTCSIADVGGRLADGLQDIDDDVVDQFGSLLPRGEYLPLLLRIEPRLVRPAQPGDYFVEEQVATWGLNSFWGLPEYPHNPYYRTYETVIDADAHLFEFVVPMVPPSWNDRQRVASYVSELADVATSTAVAVSILDVCEPAVDHGAVYFAHWALTHFLLDGHHKMQAAADSGRPLQLLSLLSIDAGLSSSDQVARIPSLRMAAPTRRHLG
ncbi:MAG TPA: hypothetical protein DGG94_07120 [Micromonosporaceae bacterium]|nr:hypothetical protein [Micromonosporaceae bacterium]HCU49557.1 hypothetical protein [Micromonosporaceae bacterium]